MVHLSYNIIISDTAADEQNKNSLSKAEHSVCAAINEKDVSAAAFPKK